MSGFNLVLLPLALSVIALAGCQGAQQTTTAANGPRAGALDETTGPLIAHLGREGGDTAAFEEIRTAFRERNPGYDVQFLPETTALDGDDVRRVVFIQKGKANTEATIPGGETVTSEVDVGDIVLLRPREALDADAPLDLVVFTTPEPLPENLPTFVRPDWDENITDTPGGCATETGAYRRILLTWLDTNGPYIYHALNAHRVRIMDSFSHYHPIDGGFDEFYLVQMVQADAAIITSNQVARIEQPDGVTRAESATLMQSHPLEVGDLVYLPRGLIHRGVGGVLAQVITAPGFRPNAEIGVDHNLRAINEKLGLTGDAAIPYHLAASTEAIVK